MADGSRHSLYQTPEATYGTTPASPTWEKIRHTGTTLGLAKNGSQSDELRADRQIADFRHGTKQVGGDILVELSFNSFDTAFEALLGGTWQTDTPVAGTDRLIAGVTRRSFSMLRVFEDLQPVDNPFHNFTGCEYNTWSAAVSPDNKVTSSFGIVGRALTTSTTAPAGSTLNAALTTSVFDSFTGSIEEGGSTVGVVTELTLNLDNGIAPRFVVGSDETILPEIGRSNLTANLTVFFENSTLLDKFINEDTSSLVFNLTDLAGNNYRVEMPNIKYTGGQPDVAGQGSITLSMPVQAIYDGTAGSQIVIDRTAA